MHLTFSTFQCISLLFPALGSESQYLYLLIGGCKFAESQFSSFLTAFLQRTFRVKDREKWVKKVKLSSFKGGGGFFSK